MASDAGNKILKIRRTYKKHRLEFLNPWEYKGKTIWDLRVKKKNKKRNA